MVEWNNRERAKQIIDFSELERRGCRPTDIDGLFEYKDKGFMLFEMKYADKPVPEGQRLALARAAQSLADGGKLAVAVIARHYYANPSCDVVAAMCRVSEVYWGHEGRWRRPSNSITLAEALDLFIRKADRK